MFTFTQTLVRAYGGAVVHLTDLNGIFDSLNIPKLSQIPIPYHLIFHNSTQLIVVKSDTFAGFKFLNLQNIPIYHKYPLTYPIKYTLNQT